jgi:hypothetical protein
MSLTYSEILTLIDDNCDTNDTKYPKAKKTRDINLAMDKFLQIAIPASGKWQYDDSNHTDYPIVYTNLVSGQRDYSFTADENSNLILDIYRVMVADSSGTYYDLELVDQQNKNEDTLTMVDGQNTTGEPTKYDKTANGIFLDLIPNYSATNGIKIFINREGSYFLTSDTIKKPGVDGRLHEYFAIRPSYYYALRKGLKQVGWLGNELIKYEGNEQGVKGSIFKTYSRRSKDETLRITSEDVNSI